MFDWYFHKTSNIIVRHGIYEIAKFSGNNFLMATIIEGYTHLTNSSQRIQRITRQVEEVHMYGKGNVNLKKEMRGC